MAHPSGKAGGMMQTGRDATKRAADKLQPGVKWIDTVRQDIVAAEWFGFFNFPAPPHGPLRWF